MLLEFCLIVQYRSHTLETIKYIFKYLQDFHKYMYMFGEFRVSKTDYRKAEGASNDLAVS